MSKMLEAHEVKIFERNSNGLLGTPKYVILLNGLVYEMNDFMEFVSLYHEKNLNNYFYTAYNKIAELKVLGAEEVLVKYQNLKEINLWKFPEYLTKLRNPIPYTLNAEEYEECLKNKQIAGGVKLKPSKYFVWYFLRD